MSINWNPKEELQLARILFSRAISRDNPERDIEVPVLKFIEEEGPAHLVTLATEMHCVVALRYVSTIRSAVTRIPLIIWRRRSRPSRIAIESFTRRATC